MTYPASEFKFSTSTYLGLYRGVPDARFLSMNRDGMYAAVSPTRAQLDQARLEYEKALEAFQAAKKVSDGASDADPRKNEKKDALNKATAALAKARRLYMQLLPPVPQKVKVEKPARGATEKFVRVGDANRDGLKDPGETWTNEYEYLSVTQRVQVEKPAPNATELYVRDGDANQNGLKDAGETFAEAADKTPVYKTVSVVVDLGRILNDSRTAYLKARADFDGNVATGKLIDGTDAYKSAENTLDAARREYFESSLTAYLESIPLDELSDIYVDRKGKSHETAEALKKSNTAFETANRELGDLKIKRPAVAPGVIRAKEAEVSSRKAELQAARIASDVAAWEFEKTQMVYSVRLKNIGEVYLGNKQFPQAKEYYLRAKDAGFDNIQGEVCDILNNVIDPAMRAQGTASVNKFGILPNREEIVDSTLPAFVDSPSGRYHDGQQQPWEPVQRDAKGNPIKRTEKKRQVSIDDEEYSIRSPMMSVFGSPVNAQFTVGTKKTDLATYDDLKWRMYPYVNANTPKEVADAYGAEVTGVVVGARREFSAGAAFNVPTFPVLGDFGWSIPASLVNGFLFQYQAKRSGADITTRSAFRLDTHDGLWKPQSSNTSEWSAIRSDFTIGTSTRSLKLLLDGAYGVYTSAGASFTYAVANRRSMLDTMADLDQHYDPTTYHMDNPFTPKETADDATDHATYWGERIRNGNRPLDARIANVGLSMSAPGILQAGKLLSLMDDLFPNWQDGRTSIDIGMTWRWRDLLMLTGDGQNPSTWDYYAPHVKYKKGDTNHNNVQDPGETWYTDADGNWICEDAYKDGSDYHERLRGITSRSFALNVGQEDIRIGNLASMATPWEFGYLGPKSWEGYFDHDSFYAKDETNNKDKVSISHIATRFLPRALWLAAPLAVGVYAATKKNYALATTATLLSPLVFPIPRALLRLIDDGSEKSTPMYLSLGMGLGTDTFTEGKVKGFSAGFGGRDWRLRYTYSHTTGDYVNYPHHLELEIRLSSLLDAIGLGKTTPPTP